MFVGQNTTLARAQSDPFGRVISVELVLIPSIVLGHLRVSSVWTVTAPEINGDSSQQRD